MHIGKHNKRFTYNHKSSDLLLLLRLKKKIKNYNIFNNKNINVFLPMKRPN